MKQLPIVVFVIGCGSLVAAAQPPNIDVPQVTTAFSGDVHAAGIRLSKRYSFMGTLNTPSISKHLELTPDQWKKLRPIIDEMNKELTEGSPLKVV